jgi:hypothetical protein
MSQPSDPYEAILFNHSTEAEAIEIRTLMTSWDQATYPTLAASIVKHAQKHGFAEDYLRYLRKAATFNKKGRVKSSYQMEQSDGTKDKNF